jgi:hypothetical protein
MPMLRFVAYGEELNVVHPPRPADPKVPWEQQYAVKLRLKSTAMLPIGEGEAMGTGAQGGTRAGGAQAPAASGARRETPPAESPAGGTQSSTPAGAVEEGVKEGVRVLRGIFGR